MEAIHHMQKLRPQIQILREHQRKKKVAKSFKVLSRDHSHGPLTSSSRPFHAPLPTPQSKDKVKEKEDDNDDNMSDSEEKLTTQPLSWNKIQSTILRPFQKGPLSFDESQESLQSSNASEYVAKTNLPQYKRMAKNTKAARSRLRQALAEYYRSMELLKNYRVFLWLGFADTLTLEDFESNWICKDSEKV